MGRGSIRRSDKTTMGGKQSLFQTTHWSQIAGAQTDDESRRQIMVGLLMEAYWKPVYSYLRRAGYCNEDAKDLTQGFFVDVVLGRELIQRADQSRGKFRSLLLTSLERYTKEVYRKDTRKKNRPKAGFAKLEADQLENLAVTGSETTPVQAFCYAWAAGLLDYVVREIQDEYCSTGRARHWEAFHSRILGPIIENASPPSLRELCERCSITDESVASNMVGTVKRRFRTILMRRLRTFVSSDTEVEEEFREIRQILSEGTG